MRIGWNNVNRAMFIAAGVLACAKSVGAEPVLLPLAGDLAVHDPVICKDGDAYYLFCTGGGRRGRRGIVPVRTSTDLRNWTNAGFALDGLPEWAARAVPRARDAWAPDIAYFNAEYHLYYSLSSFGVNNSAIGLATNKTLDRNSPDYLWVDKGMVINSQRGRDDFNAIDPNVAIEDDGKAWLSWGSFWGGIKMRRLDPSTGMPLDADSRLYSLAARPRKEEHVEPPVEGAIEAPFIIRRDGFWYLFVSFDFCCRGVRSNYNVRVGRSEAITGPYVDRDGVDMMLGGGTLVIGAATDQWRGAGHQAIFRDGDQDYLVFHAYEVANNGRSRLQISTMEWRDGWPAVAQLP
jgi:arabinan endo-1,5-alpha-L-arabinosidase